MKLEMKNKWLDKYYKGETSLTEEKELKKNILLDKYDSTEKDVFGYFEAVGAVPDDLEEQLFNKVEKKINRKKSVRLGLYSVVSAAAVIVFLLGIYLDFREAKRERIEHEFFVMEQALFQVSESIQPEEQEDMLVLWVDDDVEIIIN